MRRMCVCVCVCGALILKTDIAVAKKKHDSAGIVTTQAVGASQLLKTSLREARSVA